LPLSFITTTRMYKGKDTVCFIDPGFPVHKQQCKVLGIPFRKLRCVQFRGEKLREKSLRRSSQRVTLLPCCIPTPTTPPGSAFTETELKIIGELANKYNVVVMEDLAYFAMDFRQDFSVARAAALPAFGGQLYRQLRAVYFQLQGLQLCRAEDRHDG
jgi:aspartate/methionine/tyrosine aminotransferase